MRPDEMPFVTENDIESPVDVELMGIVEEFDGDIDDILNDMGLMGVDFDDDVVLAGALRRLFKRIKKRVRKRIKARRLRRGKKKKKKRRRIAIETSRGRIELTPEGLQIFKETGELPPRKVPFFKKDAALIERGDIMGELLKNPMMLLLPAGLMLMFVMKKKK